MDGQDVAPGIVTVTKPAKEIICRIEIGQFRGAGASSTSPAAGKSRPLAMAAAAAKQGCEAQSAVPAGRGGYGQCQGQRERHDRSAVSDTAATARKPSEVVTRNAGPRPPRGSQGAALHPQRMSICQPCHAINSRLALPNLSFFARHFRTVRVVADDRLVMTRISHP
ncbi:hypothetical protein F2981_10975 [Sinorhizobium meliloti]|nr:hypothetical protein [Sinorhizobium meliloti]